MRFNTSVPVNYTLVVKAYDYYSWTQTSVFIQVQDPIVNVTSINKTIILERALNYSSNQQATKIIS
jgi:hypothetical protein